MKDFYKRIYSELKKSENKKRAQSNKISHRYDGHTELGIASPALNGIHRRFRKEIESLSRKDALSLAEELYNTRIEEMILTGNYILQNRPECLTADLLVFLDRVLDYFCSWSTIDDFCIDVLQPILKAYPKETLGFLKEWNSSKNMWKRRVSVVAFVRKVGESGRFTDDALALCENLLYDTEDLVRKGVGWCLKDTMRGDREKVLVYVKGLRGRGVSSTITLYAIRDLKGHERKSLLS